MNASSLLFLALALFSSLTWGDSARRDGNWWLEHTREQKTYYVIGFLDGMELGNRFTWWEYADPGKNPDKDFVAKSAAAYQSYTNKYFVNVTAGQIVDGLDTFYADFKNRRIRMEGAVWLVSNGIAGTPEDKLNKLIESWRENSAN